MLKRPAWRTVVVVLFGISAALLGLLVVAKFPAAGPSYPALCGAIGFCVGAQAAKSGVQAKVNPEAPK